MADICVVLGRLSDYTVDALVIPADEALGLDSTASSFLGEAALRHIVQEARKREPVPCGSAVLLDAGPLLANHVLLLVARKVGGRIDPDALGSATVAALQVAQDKGLKSLAIAAVEQSNGGADTRACAETICQTLRRQLAGAALPMVVYLVADRRTTHEFYREELILSRPVTVPPASPPPGERIHSYLSAVGRRRERTARENAMNAQAELNAKRLADCLIVTLVMTAFTALLIPLVLYSRPLDRLGAMAWLAPVAVPFFGLFSSLFVAAWRTAALEKWMMMLLIGTFALAYPLMYFAQTFVPLQQAMLGSAGLIVAIVALRTFTAYGLRVGLSCTALAAAVLACTIVAAIHPEAQGLLMTGMTLLGFVLAMFMAPRARKAMLQSQPTAFARPAAMQEHVEQGTPVS